MTPNLVIQTLDRIWTELESRGVVATLVGGLALPIWNYPRSTQDIDLLLAVDDDQQLLSICEALDCRPKRQPAIVELGSVRVLQAEYSPPGEYVEIDVDFLIGQSEFLQSLSSRNIAIDFAGLENRIRVATCEDLILLKMQAGRLIDLADCQRLIELNPDLDRVYLELWAGKLNLTSELDKLEY
ncbi:MAG: nucleotidyl transferase AbiEii/AbiGii toxin family protein [Planctomycetales bacterium]|nr:nucleotidyl transferase AbiEii/AbiGii toxin family protein [Planctomycetales bacterium]